MEQILILFEGVFKSSWDETEGYLTVVVKQSDNKKDQKYKLCGRECRIKSSRNTI